MAATREDISWFDAGIAQGGTYMLVAVDEFEWEDYPVYVEPGGDVR